MLSGVVLLDHHLEHGPQEKDSQCWRIWIQGLCALPIHVESLTPRVIVLAIRALGK